DYFAVSIISSVIQQLVYKNRESEALMLLGAGINVKTVDGFTGGSAAAQLSWKQSFRSAKIHKDYHVAFRDLLQKRYGPLPTEEPPSFSWSELFSDWSWQSSEQLFKAFA